MSARLRLTRGEATLELEGDEAFVARWFDRLAAVAFGPDVPAAAPDAAPRMRVRKNIDFARFLEMKAPARDLDRLLVLCYFQERYEQRSEYPLDELARLWGALESFGPWQEALVEQAQDEGYLQRTPSGDLTLSFTGEALVRDGLPES